MIILAIGDVCAESGLAFLSAKLPALKKLYCADVCVVNGENSAPGGTGITKDSVDRIFAAGADVITTGNHAFDMKGFENLFENTRALLRPANLGRGVPGVGSYLFDLGFTSLAVVNLSGRVFMRQQAGNPFDWMDDFLKTAETPNIIVDFHAEATSEKIAFGRNYDGRVSLVFGTHTHVPTADEAVLAGGTAYISDIGMTGPVESVIGVDVARSIKKMRFSVPIRFQPASGPAALHGIVVEVDHRTGKAQTIERISVTD